VKYVVEKKISKATVSRSSKLLRLGENRTALSGDRNGIVPVRPGRFDVDFMEGTFRARRELSHYG